MKKTLFFIILLLSFTNLSCSEKIDWEKREKLLEKAYSKINSNDDILIIEGLRTIKKFPTHNGLKITIDLWEKDITKEVEEEILKCIRVDEVFRCDPSLIKEIFRRNYNKNSPIEKQQKLKRLLENTDVDIKKKLIRVIDDNIKSYG